MDILKKPIRLLRHRNAVRKHLHVMRQEKPGLRGDTRFALHPGAKHVPTHH